MREHVDGLLSLVLEICGRWGIERGCFVFVVGRFVGWEEVGREVSKGGARGLRFAKEFRFLVLVIELWSVVVDSWGWVFVESAVESFYTSHTLLLVEMGGGKSDHRAWNFRLRLIHFGGVVSLSFCSSSQ